MAKLGKNMTLRLRADDAKALSKLAAQEDLSQQQVMCRALREFAKKHLEKAA